MRAVAVICSIALMACDMAFAQASPKASSVVTGANLSGPARAIVDRQRPASTFGTQKLPPEPDYRSGASWAALPDIPDGADLVPANTAYPEAQARAAADVFFIHPTTESGARDNWNIPIDDAASARDLDYILGSCAGVFNAAAKVYAPRYRQAALYAFFDDRTDSGIKAVELAYSDVERAFLYYMERYNRGRPFILAGHSQGSIHGLRLLQQRIIGTPLEKKMVAAYLVGGTIPAEVSGIQPSRAAADTGVLVGWNTFTKDGDPAIFTDGLITWVEGHYEKMGSRRLLQTNPLSWELNGPAVPPSRNPGSLPVPEDPARPPLLVKAVCGADASGKVLIIGRPPAGGFAYPQLDYMPVLNDRNGDYHNFDYQLFYESIRKNAVDRVKAFAGRAAKP